ncbi:MAG TPA: hypothetical protein VLF14_03510 [Candidatus Binatia bacterium]|nr:hypothetical protein [Candidatus Binatia bacterium]
MTRGRKWGLIGSASIFLLATEATAMYTANPAGRWAQNRFFLAGDFQYNSDKDLDGGGEIKDMAGFFARPAYSIAPNLLVYGRVGAQDAEHLDSGFAGGFGIQGAYVFPRAPEWAIGGSFDFLYWDTGSSNADLTYIEYQFAPAVSYNVPGVPQLTPYAGVLVDFLGSDFDEEDPVGLLFGINFDPTDVVRLDAQFRVINETGFFLSAGYMF